jgi:hypothetical protein
MGLMYYYDARRNRLVVNPFTASSTPEEERASAQINAILVAVREAIAECMAEWETCTPYPKLELLRRLMDRYDAEVRS